MKTYEYKYSPNMPDDIDDVVEYLNTLGKEGWELVSLSNKMAIFKKEITKSSFSPSRF